MECCFVPTFALKGLQGDYARELVFEDCVCAFAAGDTDEGCYIRVGIGQIHSQEVIDRLEMQWDIERSRLSLM